MFDDFDWGDWDSQASDYYDNYFTPTDDSGQYVFDDAIGNTAGNEFGYSGDYTNYDSMDPYGNPLDFGSLAPVYGSGSGSGITGALQKLLSGYNSANGTNNLGLLKDLLSGAAGANALWQAGPRIGPPSVQATHNATPWTITRMPRKAEGGAIQMRDGGSVLDKIKELYETYGPSMKPATTEYRRQLEETPNVRHLLDDRGMVQDAARNISGRQRQLDELERKAVEGYAIGGAIPDYSDWGNLQQPVDINTLGINSPWGNLPNGPADPRLTQQPVTSVQTSPGVQQPAPSYTQMPIQDPRAVRRARHEAMRADRMQRHATGAPRFTSPSLVGYASGGQADVVEAKLSGGEYVMDADSVAALGDGNTNAGAQVLDKMRENLRKHKRSAPSNKIPPKAKSPLEYMKGR